MEDYNTAIQVAGSIITLLAASILASFAYSYLFSSESSWSEKKEASRNKGLSNLKH